MLSTVEKYKKVNQLMGVQPWYCFWSLHNKNGLAQANNFYQEIKQLVEEKKSTKCIIDKIYQHYQHGPGRKLATSFKTLLADTFSELCQFELKDSPFFLNRMHDDLLTENLSDSNMTPV